MKGVILAGGTGSRLYPVTRVINKHLLPVYDKPMIYYPIETMQKAGIKDILIILGGNSVGELVELLGDGSNFGVNISYRYQKEAGGIAQALALAEDFVGNDNVMVILGDNIVVEDLKGPIRDFELSNSKAGIFLKEITRPRSYGIAEVEGSRVVSIVEKPDIPKSNLAVTGVYLYKPDVFQMIRAIEPSERGELEITDVNNLFIEQDSLMAFYLQDIWIDAGKFESLYQASTYEKGVSSEGSD